MPDQLLRMLRSHEFLLRSLEDHAPDLTPSQRAELQHRIDGVFLDILSHETADPRITLAQVRFLLDNVLKMVANPDKGRALHELCTRHFARLEEKIAFRPAPPEPPQSREFAYLDSLSDRVAIVDTCYRYVFTNKANLEFHGKTMHDFIGRPNWEFVGWKFFEQTNKARWDACAAGRPQYFSAPHPKGDPDVIFSVKMEPITGEDGRIGSTLVVARDISTHLTCDVAARPRRPK